VLLALLVLVVVKVVNVELKVTVPLAVNVLLVEEIVELVLAPELEVVPFKFA
jgi:hypothetical protein